MEDSVVAAVGIHPKSAGALTDEVRHQLSALLRSPFVVGLGEVGLDHSVLPRHVLVLHSRGMRGQSSDEAFGSMLYQLISSVPSEQRILCTASLGTEESRRGRVATSQIPFRA